MPVAKTLLRTQIHNMLSRNGNSEAFETSIASNHTDIIDHDAPHIVPCDGLEAAFCYYMGTSLNDLLMSTYLFLTVMMISLNRSISEYPTVDRNGFTVFSFLCITIKHYNLIQTGNICRKVSPLVLR